MLSAPNFVLGVWASGRIAEFLPFLARGGFDNFCWLATLAFLLATLPPFLLVWWVAERRHRFSGVQLESCNRDFVS